jgi:cytochrome c oxidase cbb3-type subunit 3
MAEQQQTHGNAVQTTGHAWDGDLQEFNNPLPTWWLWTFYATIVFALVYWVLYPTWPVGTSFTKGINTITFEENGKEVTTHWNTRALLIKDMQSGEESLKQHAFLQKVEAASYEQIQNDPEMMAFVNSTAKGLFGDNCAACHGKGGAPAMIGQYPNLSDDSWLWGGDINAIQTTITKGRHGFMPSFSQTFDEAQLDDVASYVLSLSGHQMDPAKAAAGEKIFQGATGGCYYCHTKAATGMKAMGSANLTDAIWTVADVPGAATPEAKLAAVRNVIKHGVQRSMPTWEGRLTPAQIKLLTVYVHSLGGGK